MKQAQGYGKSYKISAWQRQRGILENRVEELIEALEAVDRLWAPERYREVELKIERYSEEIDRLEEKLKSLKG